ncbi:hypothetical protein [Maricaulis salignorans]|uniref:hypothetical protein n=1 Tax=Maricaulis salignorans TaxID=144026 RepID=UPI003A92F914
MKMDDGKPWVLAILIASAGLSACMPDEVIGTSDEGAAEHTSYVEVNYDDRVHDADAVWDAIMDTSLNNFMSSGVRDINPKIRGEGLVSFEWYWDCAQAMNRTALFLRENVLNQGVYMDFAGIESDMVCVSRERHEGVGL